MIGTEKIEDIKETLFNGFNSRKENFYKNNGNNNIKYTESKVIGILLADNNEYPMSDILDTLNDVSGEHIDFFCIGYSKNTQKNIWEFNRTSYDSFISEFRSLILNTNRQLCHQHLILINANASETDCYLDFSKSIVLDFHKINQSGINMRDLFFTIFEKVTENQKITIGELSNKLFEDKNNEFILDVLINLLAKDFDKIKNLFKSRMIYLLKDISNK